MRFHPNTAYSQFAVIILMVSALGFQAELLAQSDSITLISGRPVRGTVESYTPDNIVVNTSEGQKNVQPWNVRLIRYDGSNELVRAKSAFNDDRFTACLQDLDSVAQDLPRDVLKQEVDFFRAIASARVALRGGNVSINEAAELVGQFIQNHPESYHLYQAQDAFGDLAMSSGRFDAAIGQFTKTSACAWPEISFNGKLKLGKAQLYAGQYQDAIASFQATESDDSAEEYAIQAKLISKCLRAEATGRAGNPAAGIRMAMEIIENESSRNIELFGHAYNALGSCYAAEQKTKEAIMSFLHTDLLFTIDPDTHARALYHLVDLESKADRQDRAARARQKLTGRYRNTWWATKIQQGN